MGTKYRAHCRRHPSDACLLMIALNMPRLSDSMEEGTIVRWLVANGGTVRIGDEVAEIETDKAIVPLEAVADGQLHILAEEGSTLPVGAPVAWLLGDDEEAPGGAGTPAESDGEAIPAEAPASASCETAVNGTTEPTSGDGRDNRNASPMARRTAARLGVDMALMVGSGPQGRIMKRDVVNAADLRGSGREPDSSQTVRPTAETVDETSQQVRQRGTIERIELTSLQKTVARRMVGVKTTVPDFTITIDVDMEAAMQLRDQLREVADGTPSVNDLVVKAMALALRQHPELNASYDDGAVNRFSRVNIGVAVAGHGTLLVPTVFDADRISLGTVASETRRLAELARTGQLTLSEMSDSTATVSNLGMFGVREFAGVLNPPETVILAVGAVEQRPVVLDSALVPRPRMTVTGTFDHRVAYGVDGARFLATMRELLERPLALLV